jgi:2'-5' RNA ligase
VALVPDPSFTARAYRARQLICGQYGCWAAEMNLVHLTVADFFQCDENSVDALDARLGRVAQESHRTRANFELQNRGVATFLEASGHIFLDFTVPPDAATSSRLRHLNVLHHNVTEVLRQSGGVVPDLRSTAESYRPHLPLMQYANLPPGVFADAVEFARAVVSDLQLPQTTRAWRLMLVRFESNAAGNDWAGGRWAADLRWNVLASYFL